MQNEKIYFYNRLVNENSLVTIGDASIQRRFWTYSFSIALLCLIGGTIPTFVGYNFENVFAICMFVWELLMFSLLAYFSIRFILLENKYKVFKKRYYATLFSLLYIVLSIVFAVVANFTTEFVSYPDASFSVDFNPIFCFAIFWPLFLAYLLFCYYAFMKCFGKYAKRPQN